MSNAIKALLQMTSVSLQPVPSLLTKLCPIVYSLNNFIDIQQQAKFEQIESSINTVNIDNTINL
jgi:hypothetical protein